MCLYVALSFKKVKKGVRIFAWLCHASPRPRRSGTLPRPEWGSGDLKFAFYGPLGQYGGVNCVRKRRKRTHRPRCIASYIDHRYT